MGWTWRPPNETVETDVADASPPPPPLASPYAGSPPPGPSPAPANYTFAHAIFHVTRAGPLLPLREVHVLDGTLTAAGGEVKLHDANGTIGDTTITFGPPFYKPQYPASLYFFRNMTMLVAGTMYRGQALFDNVVPPFFCYRLTWLSPHPSGSTLGAQLLKGPAASPPAPPTAGECTI